MLRIETAKFELRFSLTGASTKDLNTRRLQFLAN